MIILLDIITFLISTYVAIKSVSRLAKNQYSALHICIIVYYLMHCFPLALQYYYGLDSAKDISLIFYEALTDEAVALCYDVITIITCCILYRVANTYSKVSQNTSRIMRGVKSKPIVSFLLTMMMYLPIIAVVAFAPDSSVYFTYSYFYIVDSDMVSIEALYHNKIVVITLYISFAFILLKYYMRRNTRFLKCIDIYFCIFLITWVSQKRTILVFVLLGILVVDFVKKNYMCFNELRNKFIVFMLVIVGYFVFYSSFVKNTGDDAFSTYTLYFSRLNVEKVAIYDLFYDNKMLDYRGQSLLYDLFFFVPRSLWPSKPGMYTKYFTAYVCSGSGSESNWLPFNYQVNIFGDWVSSLGIIGHFFALIFILFIIRKSERSTSKVMYISGIVFVLLYLMYGFEHIVIVSYLIWLFSFLKSCKIYRIKKA